MSAIDVFACPVVYKHKTRLLSFSSIFVLTLIVVTIICPLIIVHQTGGLWIRNRVYVESPLVNFAHKYFFVAETDFPARTVVCSTFSTYKNNPINDDCTIIKIREEDSNKDKKPDVLKFEARFYSDQPIKTIRLLLFFHIELRELVEATIDTMTVFDRSFNQDVQKVHFIGDLKLQQKSVLRVENFPEVYNYSVEIGEKSLAEVLTENARKKLSARLTNTQATWETGFSSDESIVISGEIFYSQELIHYQPGFWEELKWAWIQYLSVFLVFSYLSTRLLQFLFTNRRLKSYVVVPWKGE